MKLSETTIPFLEEDCLRIFGAAEGAAVFRRAEAIYQELLAYADDQNGSAIREHLRRGLFPPMAYYKALLAGGMERETALEYVRRETRRAAEIRRDKLKGLARLPFAYSFFRLSVKSYMRKNFPKEGWQTEWIRCDSGEIHFNLCRCVYWELTKAYECPELCCVYCENDDIVFSGLLPRIRFERAGTLGNGADFCDFHFIHG